MEIRREERKVGIAELAVCASPDRLITLGLGSCVGVTLYDKRARIGGMVHVMLPESKQFRTVTNPIKYADLAIPLLLEEMAKAGSSCRSLEAKMAGGAQMFSFPCSEISSLNIGQRNSQTCKLMLGRLRIPLVGEDTGGKWGRTMVLNTDDGKVQIRTMGKNIKLL